MTTTATTPSSSTDHLTPSASILDGVTSDNGGGREEGDVELALFRRIRSISNMSSRPTISSHTQSPSPSWGYTRYLHHPLSMFSSQNSSTETQEDREGPSHDHVPISKDADEEIEKENDRSNSSASDPQKQVTGVAWRDALVQVCASMLGKTLGELQADYNSLMSSTTPSANAFASQITTFEPIPRDLADYAIISTLKQHDASAMQNAPSWLFNMMDRTGTGVVLRDEFVRYAPFVGPIADFAVAGIVFDELVKEQVRVAREIENERVSKLSEEERIHQDKRIREQQQQQHKKKRHEDKHDSLQRKEREKEQIQGRRNSLGHVGIRDDVVSLTGVRQRKVSAHPLEHSELSAPRTRSPTPTERTPLNGKQNSCSSPPPSSDTSSVSLLSSSTSSKAATSTIGMKTELRPPNDMLPPSVGLQFDMWRRFFQAVQDKRHYVDDEWVRAKREVGIDAEETLIKSQGALDHSDIFPTLGKLYLSQRYLIFFAAVGRNHYVVRLGAVANVSNDSIPLMMRDCVRLTLESEAKVAMDGVSAVPKDNNETSGKCGGGGKKGNEKGRVEEEDRHELQSQHIGRLMKQFMSGRKALTFSLLEFRETKRRDNWVNLIREMVAAHKLHAQLGFGSSGRAVRDAHKRPRSAGHPAGANVVSLDIDDDDDDDDDDNVVMVGKGIGSGGDDDGNDSSGGGRGGGNGGGAGSGNGGDIWKEKKKTVSLNYTRSPFRSEPSPPLLAVAAHSNIVRYRALRRVTRKCVSCNCGLMVFSHEQRNPSLTNWYTDSVRAYQSQSGRTWVERALAAIRENMDTNERMYRVQDDEPFDIGKLGDAIGRFAELCAPLVRVIQFSDHLIQWRNPPATILAILLCIVIAANGLVHYVPAGVIGMQALWVVETKINWLGLGMGGSRSEDAAQRQRNVLELVAQVHDTLAAGQNVLAKLNRELGKLQALFLWGCDDDRDSWIAVGVLCAIILVLLVVPARSLFLCFVFFLFFKHFLPPSNPALRFWQSIPSRMEVGRMAKKAKKAEVEKRERLLLQRRQEQIKIALDRKDT